MKIAFEKGEPVPGTPAKAKTNRKSATIMDEMQAAEDVKASPNAKRKRATAKMTVSTSNSDGHKLETGSDVEDACDVKPKRAKSSKANSKPKGKATIKQEREDEDDGVFFDAQEILDATTGAIDAFSDKETESMPLVFI